MRVEELPVSLKIKNIVSKSGITELFPPQEEAIHAGVLEGKNLVLASPTASGKTLIAELCALEHVLNKGGKVLYLTPLRALASEKYEDFKKYCVLKKRAGGSVRVALSTGDYDSDDLWLGRYDIVVTTNEKSDSLLRHRVRWTDEVSLVVADEVHLLNDAERGPTLEVVLARLRQVNPEAQILTLSATIRNAEEVAGWIDASHITTDWRPVVLNEGVLHQDEVQLKDGSAYKIKKDSRVSSINLALNTIEEGGQILIFAGTRRKSSNLAKKAAVAVQHLLSKPMKRSLAHIAKQILTAGERTKISTLLAELIQKGTAFHHAGLSGVQRRIIEKAFRDGKLKVLTATPTLAFGVNLPARVVVINDYKRYEAGVGYYPISVLEYKQMAGRAGRPSYDSVGEAILVAKSEDETDFLMENYVFAKPERLWSKLAVERILRSHVLATVASDFAHTEEGVYDFFGKTFYAYQYDKRAIQRVISKILSFLYKEDMLFVEGREIYATRFGKRISELYIDPVSGIVLRDSLRKRPNKTTEISIFHILSKTPDMYPKLRPYSKEVSQLSLFADEHREELMFEESLDVEDSISYESFLAEVKLSWVLHSWIEETTEEELLNKFRVQPGDLYRLIENAKWLLHALHELAKLFKHKDLLPHLATVMRRTEKGVKKELLPLVKLQGVGRIRARILFNAGLTSVRKLKTASIDRLTSLPLIGPRLAKKIKEQVGGFVKSKKWMALKNGEWKQQALTEY